MIHMMNGLSNRSRAKEKRNQRSNFRKKRPSPIIPTQPESAWEMIEGEIELVGISIGGGKVEIIELMGLNLNSQDIIPAILVVHDDRFGAIAAVSNIIAKHELNIGHMDVSRKEKGQMALMTIEVDQPIDEAVINELTSLAQYYPSDTGLPIE